MITAEEFLDFKDQELRTNIGGLILFPKMALSKKAKNSLHYQDNCNPSKSLRCYWDTNA
jgi:hypothetical protein